MPRTRLRPEYQRMTYAFHCVLVPPIPQSLWDTAHAMQALWNLLVAQHDAVLNTFDATTTKAEQRSAYDAFWRAAYLTVRNEGQRLGLSAWPKWHVYDTFRAAQQRFARHQGGKPHAHHGLRQVLLPHRTDSGGVPLAWLWQDSDRKHTAILPRQGGHHHQDGYSTVGYEHVDFRVLLHREIPEEAILKRIALSGRFEPALRRATPQREEPEATLPRATPAGENYSAHSLPGTTTANARTRHHSPDGWQWQLLLSVEVPPREPAPPTGRSAGIDLGWRVREDSLRVAVVSDGTRAWEWFVPWDMANRALRRRQRLYQQHGAQLDTTGSWRRLWAWQGEIDAALEACKATLDTLDHTAWPAEAQRLWQSKIHVRAGGLRRLARLLAEADVTCPVLTAWIEQHTVSMRRLRGAQIHRQRQRQSLYRLLADWLARHFDTVSWEGDLDLKGMAEDPGAEPALQAARRYRQMAGLTTLRQYIREALAKRGRTLVDTPAKDTTRTCSVCGETIPPGAALLLTCLGGHTQDQDANAAMVLWQALPTEVQVRVPQTAVPNVDREPLRRSLHRLL